MPSQASGAWDVYGWDEVCTTQYSSWAWWSCGLQDSSVFLEASKNDVSRSDRQGSVDLRSLARIKRLVSEIASLNRYASG